MSDLGRDLDRIAADSGFSGVVRVDRGEEIELVRAYGFADRAHAIPNEPGTQFGTASGTKTLTALVVMRLVEDGALDLATTARSVLGSDLPLIDDGVTVEQLLAHRSGIGDYLDEELEVDPADYLMPVPVQQLATTEAYVEVLDGRPSKFAPGERFAYCNSGYVLLALIAERTATRSFHDLVRDLVCAPAGMVDTAFLRSDALPARAAVGYLKVDGEWRTNVFHLPVCGTGDGGIYTTVSDVASFWQALYAGSIVREATLAEMLESRSAARPDRGYGLGFWLPVGGSLVQLEGGDQGVAFRSVHDPERPATWTLFSNTREGIRGMGARLAEEHAA